MRKRLLTRSTTTTGSAMARPMLVRAGRAGCRLQRAAQRRRARALVHRHELVGHVGPVEPPHALVGACTHRATALRIDGEPQEASAITSGSLGATSSAHV